MTIFFPILAVSMRIFSKHENPFAPSQNRHLDVLIPAHNESAVIAETINSINIAAKYADIDVKIHVGADLCDDNTASIARSEGASVITVDFGKKMSTLRTLVQNSSSEWIAFVDAGTIWEKGFLLPFVKLSSTPDIMGIAPGYIVPNGGIAQKTSWWIERLLKKIENLAGGPVSVHGATVFYRRDTLERTMEFLTHLGNNKNVDWLNDDVVVPLTMRMLFPSKSIHYTTPLARYFSTLDNDKKSSRQEKNSRERMMIGNLQWIREILPLCWRTNPLVAVIAMRRVFRVYWAIWSIVLVATLFPTLLTFTPIPQNFTLLTSLIAFVVLFMALRALSPATFFAIKASTKAVAGNRKDKTIWK
jgi:glycosyltransferase involved in cell wall biosynthesis